MKILLLGALCITTAAFAAPPASRFVDPLDKQVPMYSHASIAPMLAVTRASNDIVAAGKHGIILTSRDGGTSWKQSKVALEADLVALDFPTPTRGWAVGHDGVVLTSEDAGKTWTKRFDGRSVAKLMHDYYQREMAANPDNLALRDALQQAEALLQDGPDKPFLDVWFKNEKQGFVIGAFNMILATEDGGVTWVPWLERTDNPQLFHLTSIRGDHENVFLVGEQGLMLKLDAATKRFVSLQSPYKGSYSGVAVQGKNVAVFGLRGRAFLSTDGGSAWKPLSTGTSTLLTAGTFLPGSALSLVGEDGTVLVSTDLGDTFKKYECGMGCYSVMPGSGQSLIVAGSRGVRVLPLK
ncbi:YCF48-related protein [Noviherbaspirillum sedimenti]|nr:YCF48-related protein [Noviherbaspirillum sedimenti]